MNKEFMDQLAALKPNTKIVGWNEYMRGRHDAVKIIEELAASMGIEAEAEKPNPQDWDGTGLPPVGCTVVLECDPSALEYGEDHIGQCLEVVSVLHDEDCVVLRLDWGLGVFCIKHIRPLRTERDKAVKEMFWDGVPADLASKDWESSVGSGERHEELIKIMLGHLYDAGYRKQRPKEQAVSRIQRSYSNNCGYSDSVALSMAEKLYEELQP